MRSVQERQVCLEAMGIQQWYARSRLPGAAVTPAGLLRVSDEVDSGVEPELPLRVVSNTPPSPLSVEEAQSALDILKKGGLKSPPEVSPKSSSGSTEPLPSSVAPSVDVPVPDNLPSGLPALSGLAAFSLVAYRSETLVVLSESDVGGSHPSEFDLLKNILKSKPELASLAVACQYHQTFNWPVFASLNLQSKQSEMAAQLLSDWFASQISAELRLVLYFGSGDTELGKFFQSLSGARYPSQRFVSLSHSLSDMLRVTTRKSDVWLQLCQHFS